jgi:hypothetical protein
MRPPSQVPFVIGQWVSGARFYGRAAELAALLGGTEDWPWIAGLRRIGKTSLLKQLEHLASAQFSVRSDALRRLPLFWDLQGAGGAEELGLSFAETLLDAEETLARLGISLREVEDDDFFASLEKLAHALRGRESGLLLLCDEADELMAWSRIDPGLAPRLWRALGAFEAPRLVLASSLRLADLGLGAGAERGAVPGLAERFAAPSCLGVLSDDEARALLGQTQLPIAARPAFDAATVEAIREACGNHPMLLQIVAKRAHELGDLAEALRQVGADHSVQHLFAVDFELLAPAEKRLLCKIARGRADEGHARLRARDEDGAPRRLLALGLLRDSGAGLAIPNRFLADWLRQREPPAG